MSSSGASRLDDVDAGGGQSCPAEDREANVRDAGVNGENGFFDSCLHG